MRAGGCGDHLLAFNVSEDWIWTICEKNWLKEILKVFISDFVPNAFPTKKSKVSSSLFYDVISNTDNKKVHIYLETVM